MKRIKTDLPGLFFEIRPCRVDKTIGEKVWVGRFTDPKTKKDRAATLGREISDEMSIDDAYVKLVEFRKGKRNQTTPLMIWEEL